MDEAKARYDTYSPVVGKLMGVEVPQIEYGSETAATASDPNDALRQQALDAIRQRPDKAAQIRASYKQKTGKELM
jgi:hypothetical protein